MYLVPGGVYLVLRVSCGLGGVVWGCVVWGVGPGRCGLGGGLGGVWSRRCSLGEGVEGALPPKKFFSFFSIFFLHFFFHFF